MKKAKIVLSLVFVIGVVTGILAYKQARSASELWCKFSNGVICRPYEYVTTKNTAIRVDCPVTAITTQYYTERTCRTNPVQGYSVQD